MAYNKYFDSISSNTSSNGSTFSLDTSKANFERFKLNSNFIIKDSTNKITASNSLKITGSFNVKNNIFLDDNITTKSNIKISNANFTLNNNKVSASLSGGNFDFSEVSGTFSNNSSVKSNDITASLKNINVQNDTFIQTTDDSNMNYSDGWTLTTGRKAPISNKVKISFVKNDWENVSNSDIVDYRDSGNNLNFRNDENEETNTLYYRPGWSNGSPDLEFLENLFDGTHFKFEITGANGVLPGWTTGSNSVLKNVPEYYNLGISDEVKKQNQTIMIDLSDAVDNDIIPADYQIYFEFFDHEIPPVVTHLLWHSNSIGDNVSYSFPNSGSTGNSNAFNNNDFCFTSIHCHPDKTYYDSGNVKNENLFNKADLGPLKYYTAFDTSDDGNEWENRFLPIIHNGTTLVTSKPRLLLNLGNNSTIRDIDTGDSVNTSNSPYLQKVYVDSGLSKEPVISNDNFISSGQIKTLSDDDFNITTNAFFNPTSSLDQKNKYNYKTTHIRATRRGFSSKSIFSKGAIKDNDTDKNNLNYNRIFPCRIYDNFISGEKLSLDDLSSDIKSRFPNITLSNVRPFTNVLYDSSNSKTINLSFSGTPYESALKRKYLNIDLTSKLKSNFYNKINSDWQEYTRIKSNDFNNVSFKYSNNLINYRNNLNADATGLVINRLIFHIPYVKIKESSNTYSHLSNFTNNGSIYSLNNFINSYSNYFGSNKVNLKGNTIVDSFIQGDWVQYDSSNFDNSLFVSNRDNFGTWASYPPTRRGELGGIITSSTLFNTMIPLHHHSYNRARYIHNSFRGISLFQSLFAFPRRNQNNNSYFNITSNINLQTITNPDNLVISTGDVRNIDLQEKTVNLRMSCNFKALPYLVSKEDDPSNKRIHRFKLTLVDKVNKVWSLSVGDISVL